MILTPRGEGINLKTLGGEQAKGTHKGKGKASSLSEYLDGFAELLKSFSPPNTSKSILLKSGKGDNLEGKESLVTRSNPSLQEKGRHAYHRKQKPSLSRGETHQQDALKARFYSLEKVLGDPLSFLKSKEGVNELLSHEGTSRGNVAPKGEGKDRKATVRVMDEMPSKKGVQPYTVLTMPSSRTEKKDQTNPSNLRSAKSLPPEETKTIQGKDRTDKLLKAKMVSPLLPETSPPLEGEKPEIESNLPRIQLQLDVSGEFRKIFEQEGGPTGSSNIGGETVLQQLREKANPQIVQQAQLFLKNQEDGEIRLILKPEQLGEVRIRLHLQDRLIEGRITVENTTVKELFDQNMSELSQAFREQGFEMFQVEVSVGNNPQHKESENEFARSNPVKASKIAEQVPSVERGWIDAHRLIDYYA